MTESKLKAMKEEIDKLGQKQAELIYKLKNIELPIKRNDCSVEIIFQRDNIRAKLTDITKRATKQIDIATPLQELTLAFINRPRNVTERILKSVKMRIVTEKCEIDTFAKEILQLAETNNNPIELRQTEKLLFDLIIVDDKEAMWTETNPRNEETPTFWTDNPTQITILKSSFENLWQKSTNV